LKGIDLVLRLAHCPDRRNSWYLEGQSAAIWSGPTFELATNSFTEWTTFFYGSQDRLIHRWIKDHARPDWVCVDVGMNFGFFTCLCGQLCLEVHGFEPVASLVARAKRNCGLNNLTNVIFNELALADTIGELRFNLPREDSCNLGTGSLVHAGQGTIVTVRAATLDDYCQRAGMTRLDFAKIDVEGAEHLVLRGGGNALQVFRPAIIFEWNADSFDEVRRILIRHRYRIHDLKGRSLDKPRCRADALTNMLALPE
jgi:FkbM family methyltransferase